MNEISLPYQWELLHYQAPLWKYLEAGGLRAMCEWHRKAGKDLLGINFCATKMVESVGLYWHIFPTYTQGKKTIWDGRTKPLKNPVTGQVQSRHFLSYFPEELILDKNNTDMKITFRDPDNKDRPGSIYQVVGVDNPDALRGPNPLGVIFSEFAQTPNMMQAWDIVRPVLAQNGGWAIFIYTPLGHGHAYKMFKRAENTKGWFTQKLTVEDTYFAPAKNVVGKSIDQIKKGYPRMVTEKAVQAEREAGMPEEIVQQEFYVSSEIASAGAWFSKEITAMNDPQRPRITRVSYIEALPVHVSWDLGFDDETALWFIQIVGQEIHLIDCYSFRLLALSHVAEILQKKPYKVYGKHYMPHDVEVTEMGPGKSRLEQLIAFGVLKYSQYEPVEAHNVFEGNNVVRSIFSRIWIDKDKCEEGLESLKRYTQRYDMKKDVYKEQHDRNSHYAASLRTFAVGFRDPVMHQKGQQRELVYDMPDEPLLYR